jgi:phage shock protein E
MIAMKRMVVAGFGVLLACAALAKDVVIDVRTPQEFQGGHVEGALNLPHDSIAQTIAKANVSKDDHVILYCRSGRRSEVALGTLKGMGFSNIENYGGFEEAQKRLKKP